MLGDRSLQLEALVAALFPVPVGVGITDPLTGPETGLFHVEQEAIRHAVPARQREFRAGRAAARMAQAALGLVAQAVPMGSDRAPIWPDGLCGTISHAGDTCIAVVCNNPAITALGLDIEVNEGLPPDVLDTVLLPDERRLIDLHPSPESLARLFFSAKECAYKAQYPLTGQLFGFDTIAITVDLAQGVFEARFTRPVPPFARDARLAGRLSIIGRLIVTAIAVPA